MRITKWENILVGIVVANDKTMAYVMGVQCCSDLYQCIHIVAAAKMVFCGIVGVPLSPPPHSLAKFLGPPWLSYAQQIYAYQQPVLKNAWHMGNKLDYSHRLTQLKRGMHCLRIENKLTRLVALVSVYNGSIVKPTMSCFVFCIL